MTFARERSKTSERSRPNQRASTRRRGRRRRSSIFLYLAVAMIICLAAILIFGMLLTRSSTNVLILGIDRRPGEGDAVRSDTLLLLHSDPQERRLALLSIPRDLWVSIPGTGQERINAAHVYGELESPGNGPVWAVETIQANFEIPVNHYLRLDFDAFQKVIDAAGGIDIDVPTTIIDNAYPTDDYGITRIEIPAGLQHMNGAVALQYARTRHDSSDFDRAARQQQIFIALVKKMTSPKGWMALPKVYQAFQNAVETDLRIHDLIGLALAWQRASETGLERVVIDRQLTTPYRTPQGAAVLIPRWELIQPLVQAQFAP